MNRSDLVSVIIPCFNDGRYLHDAINSIMSQTYQNFEIIIVDDGSEDRQTTEILANLSLPKTSVYHKDNGGPASARNFGIKKSNGRYILTLDADDRFDPTFLEKAMNILKDRPEVGMVTSYVIRMYANYNKKVQLKGGDISSFILQNEASASLLYRYKCWEDANGYDEKIPGFEDWDFAISVTKKGWLVYSIPEYLFYYRNINNTQYNKDSKIRPEIIKYLTSKHESVFKQYIQEVINDKELQIQEYSKIISLYKNSIAYKTGVFILRPVKWIKKMIQSYGF